MPPARDLELRRKADDHTKRAMQPRARVTSTPADETPARTSVRNRADAAHAAAPRATHAVPAKLRSRAERIDNCSCKPCHRSGSHPKNTREPVCAGCATVQSGRSPLRASLPAARAAAARIRAAIRGPARAAIAPAHGATCVVPPRRCSTHRDQALVQDAFLLARSRSEPCKLVGECLTSLSRLKTIWSAI
jgi:hypothetical protein